MAIKKDVTGFALSKLFMLNEIFPKYEDIRKVIQKDAFNLYTKHIYETVNKRREYEINQMNKKSSYRNVIFEKNTQNKHMTNIHNL